MSTSFGAALRLLRVERGLSLRDLARRLEVSGAYLSRVENGVDATPTPARILAMARELGVPPTLLLDLAHGVSPLVVDYVEAVPEAGALFLDIAHRRLTAAQIGALRRALDEIAPPPRVASWEMPRLGELLSPERVVLGLTCAGMDDVLDVAAGRLSAPRAPGVAGVAAALKAREREVPSALGGGVAVPCVATSESAAVLMGLATPLPCATPDGVPLRLVVVLGGPRGAAERPALLAHIARLAAWGLADAVGLAVDAEDALARVAALER